MIMKNFVVMLALSAISIGARAQEQVGESVFDYVEDPAKRASAIVIFTPSIDMPLNIVIKEERVLVGKINEVQMGEAPGIIAIPPETIIRPLFAGVPVQIFLQRSHDRDREDVYYPIAIFTPRGAQQ